MLCAQRVMRERRHRRVDVYGDAGSTDAIATGPRSPAHVVDRQHEAGRLCTGPFSFEYWRVEPMNPIDGHAVVSRNNLNSQYPVVSDHRLRSARRFRRTRWAWTTLSASIVGLSVLCMVPSHAQGTNAVLEWNLIASNAAVAGGQNSVVQTRTFAIVQAAVHDALNAI